MWSILFFFLIYLQCHASMLDITLEAIGTDSWNGVVLFIEHNSQHTYYEPTARDNPKAIKINPNGSGYFSLQASILEEPDGELDTSALQCQVRFTFLI